MEIVQDVFSIPDDIATGLATGIYRRIGSVVRYAMGPNKGKIVKHLQPIDLKDVEQAQEVGSTVQQFVKQHKKESIIITVGVAAVGTAIGMYLYIKYKEPKVVTDFRASLKVYIEAIRKGDMDIDKINDLMEKIEKLKMHKNYEKICIQLTNEDLEVLIGHIYEYTVKLANDNKAELVEDELCFTDKKGADIIVNLQIYLEKQKCIFEEAI